jgi:DNA repair ATPase RecN
MMDVHIEDYQAIDQLDFTIDGFTVMVGRSNIGKSSVLRAIRGLMVNEGGDHLVRQGSSHCEVHLQCPEIDVLWKKGSGYNDYVINGEAYESVGHHPPDAIAEAGFRSIEGDREAVMPQITPSQFEPLFLLDEKGSIAAEILSDVGRLGDVQEALKRVQSEMREHQNSLRVRREDLEDAQQELETYDGLEDDMKQVEEARRFHDEIARDREEIEMLTRYLDRAEDLQDTIDRYQGVSDVDIPAISVEKELHTLQSLSRQRARRDNLQSTVHELEGVSDVEIPEAPQHDYQTLDKLRSLRDQRDELIELIDRLDFDGSIDCPDSGSLERLLDTVRQLESWRDQRDQLVNTIQDLKSDIEETVQEFREMKRRLEALFEEAGRCPVCDQEYDT